MTCSSVEFATSNCELLRINVHFSTTISFLPVAALRFLAAGDVRPTRLKQSGVKNSLRSPLHEPQHDLSIELCTRAVHRICNLKKSIGLKPQSSHHRQSPSDSFPTALNYVTVYTICLTHFLRLDKVIIL